jgi:hypothetical protein
MKGPQTLQDAIKFFADYENCHQFMIAVRMSKSGSGKNLKGRVTVVGALGGKRESKCRNFLKSSNSRSA